MGCWRKVNMRDLVFSWNCTFFDTKPLALLYSAWWKKNFITTKSWWRYKSSCCLLKLLMIRSWTETFIMVETGSWHVCHVDHEAQTHPLPVAFSYPGKLVQATQQSILLVKRFYSFKSQFPGQKLGKDAKNVAKKKETEDILVILARLLETDYKWVFYQIFRLMLTYTDSNLSIKKIW